MTTSQRPIGLVPGAPAAAAGQDARKYSSTNPVVRELLDRWIRRLGVAAGPAVSRLLDVGTGEGLALHRLGRSDGIQIGVEYREDKVRLAIRDVGIAGVCADAGMLPFPDKAFPLVMCTEVLEHLTRPSDAVSELARVSAQRCVVSVPWEPWFRFGNLLRGKNVRRLGNDAEHVQAFTPARLRRLLAPDFSTVTVLRSWPWLIAVAERDSR